MRSLADKTHFLFLYINNFEYKNNISLVYDAEQYRAVRSHNLSGGSVIRLMKFSGAGRNVTNRGAGTIFKFNLLLLLD